MPLNDEQKIEIWKRSIETQMHFAELSIKMRQIGITLAGATIALAIFLYKTDSVYSFYFQYINLNVPIGSVLMLSAAGILYAAKIIDVGVYHKMLRGAVKFNELYEQSLDIDVGWRTGLTESISAYSRYKDPTLQDKRGSDGTHWTSKSTQLAGNKINHFYWFCILALIFAAIALAFVDKVKMS